MRNNMNKPPKSFIGQLFCKHNYEQIGDQRIFENINDKKANLPIKIYDRWECNNCRKIIRRQRV